jgi:hypothetical protein
MSCINQIPVQLLVGPAAPIAQAPDFLYRYSRDMFSVARPQFVKPPAEQAFSVAYDILTAKTGVATSAAPAALRALAVKPLNSTGQGKNEGLGFFEGGFFIGASFTLSIMLPLLGLTGYLVGRKGLELAMRLRH